ncbi:dihydrolipoyl dehydrogenase [Candidatus Micrarchaeota archaeon]|nr:MAG: dihydrolipoyl dehydrogenase [Candidatus Micrarchaeota archaeon]
MVMGDLASGCDVLVIGGGPGGYVAAIRAAQLGKDVMIVDEKGERGLGGLCLNDGCIPSKALIYASEIAGVLGKESEKFGISVEGLKVDMGKMQEWKQGVVDKLNNGVKMLCKRHGIAVVKGEAFFKSSGKVGVRTEKGIVSVEFGHAIIATGSNHRPLEKLPFDGKQVVSSTEALKFSEVPKELLVVGGGYIGLELGTVYAKLGSKVKIVTHGSRVLRGVDRDLVEVVLKRLDEIGVEVLFDTAVEGKSEEGERLKVKLRQKEGKVVEVDADKVLIAIGHSPNTKELGLDKTNVKMDEKGYIKVDERMRTADHKIYAVGDAVGAPLLAHKASRQGVVAAEAICGMKTTYHNRAVPAVVFTDPEVASVGISEEEAKEQGKDFKVGKFPFRALGRALTRNKTEGFVKIVAEKDSGLVLGIHIVGSEAGELISEGALAVELGAVLEDLAATIHPHPTLSEALSEAADATLGKAIHIFQPKIKPK